jgi:hypothetical protein
LESLQADAMVDKMEQKAAALKVGRLVAERAALSVTISAGY